MNITNNVFRSVVVGLLSFQLVSCGTILYPERRGQKAGHLDVGVVLLDAIGLLFFLIPGIIAFAVDFSNGTIYLPNTAGNNLKEDDYRTVKFDPKTTSQKDLEAIITKETGKEFHFNDTKLEYIKLEEGDDLSMYFNAFENQVDIVKK